MNIVRIIMMMITATVIIASIYPAQAAAGAAIEGKFTVKNSPPEVDLVVSKNEQMYIIKVNIRDANSIKDINKIILNISNSNSHIIAVWEHERWEVDGNLDKIVRVNQSISSETWIFYVKLREGTWKVVAKVYDGETFAVEDQTIVVKYSSTSDDKLDTNKVATTDTPANWLKLTKFIRSLYAPFESILRLSIIIRDLSMALNHVLMRGFFTPSNIFFAL
ncbi:hypothetical protein Asulf_01453 [Archaeoglobus sulfaticallidus PM70-1]|uniref:Uncharacterized protein n=1 Tax=Archaeoglobus sulfaticallidus PM70-1 TaxID=387631 RepID=N0BLM0_9EURY|nr:hypothetical protein [Archaeoglobus sulfaticallidus]AGK61436.1 hypothetical protein Asulf_01453 [Archaeoglobus sulfaticallidus PM70-1]